MVRFKSDAVVFCHFSEYSENVRKQQDDQIWIGRRHVEWNDSDLGRNEQI